MKNSFNDLKKSLSEHDIDQIVTLLGYRCRIRTCQKLRSVLTYMPSSVPSYGIFERLTKETSGWEYTAGQSYPDEIRTLRNAILKGI